MENSNDSNVGSGQSPASNDGQIIESRKRSFFNRFHYKILFVLSVLSSIFALIGFVGTINNIIGLSQHGSLGAANLLGSILLLGILLGLISLIAVTYSYIRAHTLTSRLSAVCAIIIDAIFIIALAIQAIFYVLVVMSGGLFLLIPGATSIISSQSIDIGAVIFFLAFVGLIFSFTKSHKAEKMKIILLWIVVLIIVVAWLAPRFLVNSGKPAFLGTPVEISATGSTNGWLTYENSQVGVSFQYPPSWPTPSYYGIDGHGNPDITVQENRKPMILDIEIGQKISDGRTCDACVPMGFDEAVSSFGPYLGLTSPNYKSKTIKLNGKTYVLFTTDGDGGNAIVFIPNDVSPNNYAMVSYDITDLDTLYLFLENFSFIGWTPPSAANKGPTLTYTTDNLLATSTWETYTSKEGNFTFKYPKTWETPQYSSIGAYGLSNSQITINMGNRTLFLVWNETQNGVKKKIADNTDNIPGKAIINGISYVATFSESTDSPDNSPKLYSVYVQNNQSDINYVQITGDGYLDAQTLVDIASSLSFLN